MTHNYESFNIILGDNAAGFAQARTKRDWEFKVVGCGQDEFFHQLSNKIQESLITTAIRDSPQTKKEELVSVAKQ